MDGWTIAGLYALHEWFGDMEEDTGEETELDVIAICCDFTEAGSAVEWCNDFGCDLDYSACGDDEEREHLALDYLRENTSVIEFDGGVIAAGF